MHVIPGRPCAPKPQSSRLSFSPRPAEPVERSAQPGPGTPLLGAACVFHLISQSSCKAGCAQTPRGPGRGRPRGVGGRNRVGEKGTERLTTNGAHYAAREPRGWEAPPGAHGAPVAPGRAPRLTSRLRDTPAPTFHAPQGLASGGAESWELECPLSGLGGLSMPSAPSWTVTLCRRCPHHT